MKIILTGASGFLGRFVYKELANEHEVVTVSRLGASVNANLAIEIPKLPSASLVIHCAGKAHSIPKTIEEKKAFFDVNLTGTANLINGLEDSNELPKAFVFISTVAVYGCEYGNMIDENHPLDANDPYGLSKIQAERLIQKWCTENNVICTILRLPLLVGEHPPGNLGSMIKAIRKGYYFNIGGGKAKKSMVFAEDVAKIIPTSAKIGGVYNLTDGYHPSFAEISESIAAKLDKVKPFNIPIWFANVLALVGALFGNKAPINIRKMRKITNDLTFDDRKARTLLAWKPKSVLNNLSL
ncbi:NAD-dependent epimerase/dehydratase family protein [Pedobacter namyangjuensis]|uniref:NAD-dependent epimerase/dehydratase family protein n=1 Tax=Pedobacter namyangjuensis TaxID=600626 RepID=UPI000DE54789|nr:NAD-dependent epimerase/dehydratase family protein [Pedobacter namyangjuensis]